MNTQVIIPSKNLSGNGVIAQLYTAEDVTTEYKLYAGETLLYTGTFYCGKNEVPVDLTDLCRVGWGAQEFKIVVNYPTASDAILVNFTVYAGGISKMLLRQLIANSTNIFDWKLKNNFTNFFLTTRSFSRVIAVPEDEVLPLQFFAQGLKFDLKRDGDLVKSFDFTNELKESVMSIDLKAIRREYALESGIFTNRFDVFFSGGYCCTLLLTEVAVERSYFIKFRNSLAAYEQIAVEGVVEYSPKFAEQEDVSLFDADVNDFKLKNGRKKRVLIIGRI